MPKLPLRLFLVGLVPIFMVTGPAFAESLDCDELLRLPFSIRIEAEDKLITDAQINEVKADIEAAYTFAVRFFKTPNTVIVSTRLFGDEAQHLGGRKMRAPYHFGKWQRGEFVQRTRLQSQTVAYHEFGHIVFEWNVDDYQQWQKKHWQNVSEPDRLEKWTNFNPRNVYEGYHELFADTFAVALTRDLQAHSKHPDSPRNFMSSVETKNWNQTEPHVFFGPARAAIGRHPRTQYLIARNPARLVQLVLEAIKTEMQLLSGPHAMYLSELRTSDLNRRLINELNKRFDSDRNLY